MEGITSRETQLKVISAVDNVKEEIEKIEEENKVPERTVVDNLTFGGVNNAGVEGMINEQ